MFDMRREELVERLKRLDEDAYLSFDSDGRFHLIIVGGGALALDEDEARASALNDSNYADFKASYDEYARRCRPCGN